MTSLARRLVLLTVLLLAISLAACSGQSQTPTDGNPGNQDITDNGAGQTGDQIRLKLAGASPGGIWGASIQGVVQGIIRDGKFNIDVIPGTDGANVVTLAQGEADMATNFSPMMKLALDGADPYPQSYDNLRALFAFNALAGQLVVTEDTPWNSLAEARDQGMPIRLAVNQANTTMEIAARTVVEGLGLSYEEIEQNGGSIQFVRTKQSADLIRSNKLDGSFMTQMYPDGSYEELNRTHPLKMLPIDEEVFELTESRLGLVPCTLPANTFSFQSEPVDTICGTALFVVRNDMPEEVAYELVRAVYENIDYIKSSHELNQFLSLEFMADVTPMELHPGAARFYAEQGLSVGN